uniref:Osteoclast-stimulating factor 1 n=2 Tax=Iconisemion striatum TaxID=60296 RepID=A0A1A7W7D5_9TELE
MNTTMEVLVLVNFEGALGDELTVKMGDVVKNVTKASEEGWLEGELRGKTGIFPATFVKEIPGYLTGDNNREPRSLRKAKKVMQMRKCEVAFAYAPQNDDELELAPGEIVDIIKEIEDGWWMGVKNGKVGAFPSNFVKEIFVAPKDGKYGEGKARPKLADAVFSKENSQRASVRHKAKKSVEYCQVLFDYKSISEDELNLKKGDIVAIVNKETEDEGWWEGELNGHCGYFPDNFVMVLPPRDALPSGNTNLLPTRVGTMKVSAKTEASAMEKRDPAKTKDDKPETKDLRSNPPTKVRLPPIKPVPPPVKDKPIKVPPNTTNGDAVPPSPKKLEEKEQDNFDGIDVHSEKLSHPTANRAKPPHRRPPTAQAQGAAEQTDQKEPESGVKKPPVDKLLLQKGKENLIPSPAKPENATKTPPVVRPAPPKVVMNSRNENHKEELTLGSLQAEIKELRMALELFQTRHEHDMQEVREELKEERNKRMSLQEEMLTLKAKK